MDPYQQERLRAPLLRSRSMVDKFDTSHVILTAGRNERRTVLVPTLGLRVEVRDTEAPYMTQEDKC